MSRPSILLVPGSFARPDFYQSVLDAVAAKGYDIRGLHLPTVGLAPGQGRDGTPPTMYDDAAFIAKAVETLADEGKDVILVAHSYGGVPITQSAKGLGKKERQRQGKNGGLVHLAYMTAVVPAIGKSTVDVLADVPKDQQQELPIDAAGWLHHSNPANTAALAFSRHTPEEGEFWVKRFSAHSAISFANELTYAGYKDVPVSYLLCEEDLIIPPNLQKAAIDMMETASGTKVNVTSIKADHCPNTSATGETIDWILDVAKRCAASGA